ncbi:hypothetical protein SLEP1_g45673 [Rubroshorea leprosula]|uniref:WAT1-related protein n=1 Tax=Rubroshorea leprosula TaxID=152421 RepID=A0AAV5LLC4_9ROSI|nr:hypothetical protein SLEP1_g45673 [Rubroshorea leprosula]
MADQSSFGWLSVGLKKAKPFLAMVSLQFGYAGMYIITIIALKKGMSHYILSVYRHVIAFLIMAPFALVLERKVRPKLTLPIFLRIMALGLLEPVLDQNLYNVGMTYTSATMGATFVNMLPAVTFILAMIFRLEKVNVKKFHSVAKVIGTVITVMGAMVMTLYTGPAIHFIKSAGAIHHGNTTESDKHNHFIGILLLFGSICSWSGFFILQSFTLKKYPAELSLTALVCLVGAVEGAVVSLIFERDMSVWKVGFNSKFVAIAYSGVVCSGIAYYVQGVVIRERGPVFLTSFSPLCMIITATLGAIVLKELIHLGSILGAILIVIGLYTVVWGKSKDTKSTSEESIMTKDIGKNQELPIVDHGGIIDGPVKILKIPAADNIRSDSIVSK